MLKPLFHKRFWFYKDWEGRVPYIGSDEYGWLTVVVPLGKGRAVCFETIPHYMFCKFCNECRVQTLEMEQDNCYLQTYWNLEDYDEVFDLDIDEIDEALGIQRSKK